VLRSPAENGLPQNAGPGHGLPMRGVGPTLCVMHTAEAAEGRATRLGQWIGLCAGTRCVGVFALICGLLGVTPSWTRTLAGRGFCTSRIGLIVPGRRDRRHFSGVGTPRACPTLLAAFWVVFVGFFRRHLDRPALLRPRRPRTPAPGRYLQGSTYGEIERCRMAVG